jgi:hypothetical protein
VISGGLDEASGKVAIVGLNSRASSDHLGDLEGESCCRGILLLHKRLCVWLALFMMYGVFQSKYLGWAEPVGTAARWRVSVIAISHRLARNWRGLDFACRKALFLGTEIRLYSIPSQYR